MVQGEVEMLLYLIGFNVVGIRAQHKTAKCNDIVDSFNNQTSNLQILITSLRISVTTFNLQNNSSDVVFIDTPSSAQNTLQADGQVLRIGQRRICHIYIMMLDHSYDQVV